MDDTSIESVTGRVRAELYLLQELITYLLDCMSEPASLLDL